MVVISFHSNDILWAQAHRLSLVQHRVRTGMLNVFFTVDVEIWCDGWHDIDAKFPEAFSRYIYGRTPRGDYGLSYQLRLLRDHGLTGVFFVEPLFAARFGPEPLAEITGLIREHGHEIQLHLHTEWVDEAKEPLLHRNDGKKQFLHYFDLEDQTTLIATGLRLLDKTGNAAGVNAFRAGSFAFNVDTLIALARNGIRYDSSYNASTFGPGTGVRPGELLCEPTECAGIYEYPMTVYRDGTAALRHAQLTACSFQEMQGLLWQALAAERKAVVLLSHNFELLNAAKTRADATVVKRFQQLCRFLDRHRDKFHVDGFHALTPESVAAQPAPLTSPLWKTGVRMMEQALRRRYA